MPSRVTLLTHQGASPFPARIAVSLTPLALEADSRALKVAMSLRRFGFRSIVFEGARSATDFAQYGVEVHSLGPPAASAVASRGSSPGPHRKIGPLGQLLRFVWFWTQFVWRYGVVPSFRVPRADLYYVHSYEHLLVPLFPRRHARIIYDAHDFYRDMYPPEMQSALARRYLVPSLAWLETLMARRCDAIVTVSQGVSEAIENAMKVRAYVVPNASDRRMNTKTSCNIRDRIGLTPDQILLTVVGNNKSETRFDYIAAILSHLPSHIHVAFVGRGYEVNDEDLPHVGVRKRIHFIPAVPPFEISSFITGADVGLLLYRPISVTFKNSLPNRFFHFLDAGLPIARFALPEVERIVGGASLGPILDPTDPIQAAKALSTFLADADARQVAGKVATKLGETFTWEAHEHVLRTVVQPQSMANR